MTMTETPAPPTTADPTETGSKGSKAKGNKKEKAGRSNLLPAVVLAVGIAAGGWFMGGSGNNPGTETPTTADPAVVPGPLVSVKPMTVNLAGGHYLRLGVSFQMTDQYDETVESDDSVEFANGDASKAKDMIISAFGGRDSAELARADGREGAREDLLNRANELFDGQVMAVFYTDFVIQ